MSEAVREVLFDLSDEYEAMLNMGIRLSGESMVFFQEGRLMRLRERMRLRAPVRRILDFGCGLGNASKRLQELFPGAEVTGADTSVKILEAAEERNGGPGIKFVSLDRLEAQKCDFDLCYVNGVFHHIVPEERGAALDLIRRALRVGGVLALFENNPWNVGTRLVMSRIPFDRDARPFSCLEAGHLLQENGFDVISTDTLFFFPRALRALRFTEPSLSWTRLGAQYLVMGERR